MHDKHYIINGENYELLSKYPYELKDYAINIINTSVNDGTIKYNGVDIGTIAKIADDKIKIKFLDLANATDLKIAIIPNSEFTFTNEETLPTNVNFYNITWKKDDNLFLLAPETRSYYNVYYGYGAPIGKIKDYKVDTDGNFISGRITIATDNTDLRPFNSFDKVAFSQDNRTISCETETITLAEDNKSLIFRKGNDAVDYCSIETTDAVEFGQIIKGKVDIVDDKVANFEMRYTPTSSDVTFDVEDGKFLSYLSPSLLISGEIDGTTATINTISKDAYYAYECVASGSTESNFATVIIDRPNTLIDSVEYDYVKVVLKSEFLPAKFKDVIYKLYNDKNTTEDIWTVDKTLDDGSTIHIDFNKSELAYAFFNKPTGFNGNAVYNVIKESEYIYNTDTAYTCIYSSVPTNITAYNKHTIKFDAEYHVQIASTPSEVPAGNITLPIEWATDSSVIKFMIPDKSSTDDTAREFIIDMKFKCAVDKMVKLQFVDTSLREDTIDIVNNDHSAYLVHVMPEPKWTTLKLQEIAQNKFIIVDFSEREFNDIFDAIKKSISKEVEDRINADEELSTAISTETKNRIDADKGLSDIISTETDNRISDTTFLSGELIALSGHYQSNMAVDVELPYFIDKPDGSRERVEKIVDQLLISDEDDPTVTYKLTIKGGVLTIVKHSID